jgi:hypothetical protein
MAITPHAYFFVDQRFLGADGRFADEAALRDVIKYFEEVAIPTDTRYFGEYPQPPGDIDDDPRLTVLFTKMYDGVVGYFDPENSAPGAESNLRDMLYAGAEMFKDENGIDSLKATLIHELEHMIVFNYKDRLLRLHGQKALDETKFVDEGMAVARHIGGEHPNLAIRDLARRARVLARNPARRLALLQEAGLVDDQHRFLVG